MLDNIIRDIKQAVRTHSQVNDFDEHDIITRRKKKKGWW